MVVGSPGLARAQRALEGPPGPEIGGSVETAQPVGSVAATPALGRLTGNYPDSRKQASPASPPADRLDRFWCLNDIRTRVRKHAVTQRIAMCGTIVYTDPHIVTQELASGERRVHWSGVMLCQRAGCPVCATTAAGKFREKVERTLRGAGGLWQHVIITVPHQRGDSWRATYNRVLAGLQELSKGLAGSVVMPLVEATIRAAETTVSERSGWHPHCHLMWKLKRPLLLAEQEILQKQWADRTGASPEHGLRLGASFDCSDGAGARAAANYVGKLAQEMSGGHKHAHPEHWTLGEVYSRAADGDARSIAWVREYQEQTKGRRLYQFDARAKALHDAAPELPELQVVQEWHTLVDRAEFSGLSRAERYLREPAALWLPLEVAARSRGDPADAIADTITSLLQAFDSG